MAHLLKDIRMKTRTFSEKTETFYYTYIKITSILNVIFIVFI